MSIFNDVVENTKSAARFVGKKAGKLVDISKLKITETNISGDINKKYRALGEKVYNLAVEATEKNNILKDIEEEVEEIKELQYQLKTTRDIIADKTNKTTCDNCGEVLNKDDLYCSNCGQKVEVETTEETSNEEVAKENKEVEENKEETSDKSEENKEAEENKTAE